MVLSRMGKIAEPGALLFWERTRAAAYRAVLQRL
jgi:hypothetical protein